MSLTGFGINNTGLIKWIRKFFLLFHFLEKFVRNHYYYFIYLVEFSGEAMRSWNFCFRRHLISVSIILLIICLFRFSWFFTILHVSIQFIQHHVQIWLSFLQCMFLTTVLINTIVIYSSPLVCVWFSQSTMIFYLLWICTILWNKVLFHLPALFFLHQIVLTWVSCASIWILGLVCYFYDKCHWNFGEFCIESAYHFWWYDHFSQY
jgi:hypothetical protein